jgi:hypothetical protein
MSTPISVFGLRATVSALGNLPVRLGVFVVRGLGSERAVARFLNGRTRMWQFSIGDMRPTLRTGNREDQSVVVCQDGRNKPYEANHTEPLQFITSRPISHRMNTVTKQGIPARPDPDLLPADAPPTVIVAPELRGRRDGVVIREPEDTNADYQARCDLVTLLLDHAEKA